MCVCVCVCVCVCGGGGGGAGEGGAAPLHSAPQSSSFLLLSCFGESDAAHQSAPQASSSLSLSCVGGAAGVMLMVATRECGCEAGA